jgi:two-component system cell cycle sensor histidine kinase/response regulator CckA
MSDVNPIVTTQPVQERMEAMSHFAGEIGLRLGKYLMTVLGESNYLLGLHPPGDKSRPWIEQIKSAAGSAAQLTQQLITFSCRLQPEAQLVSLHTVVKKLAEQFTSHFQEGMARGDFRIDIQLDPHDALVLVDSDQLENALLRLVKWSHDRLKAGTLKISTCVPADSQETVILTLQDNGERLPSQEVDKLFEPFHQIDPETPDLGLALAYGILRQANGEVCVESDAHSTTMRIKLPIATPETSTAVAAAAPAPKSTVLLVDDEELVRNYLVIALKHMGYEVIAAKDGNEALFHCLQSNVNMDVLLTDLILPGMNGRQLAEQVKKIRPTLKFIFMSGYTENLLGQGRVFLRKPIMPDLLSEALQHVLNSPRDSLSKALSSSELNLK